MIPNCNTTGFVLGYFIHKDNNRYFAFSVNIKLVMVMGFLQQVMNLCTGDLSMIFILMTLFNDSDVSTTDG